jgi:hypothetical protein
VTATRGPRPATVLLTALAAVAAVAADSRFPWPGAVALPRPGTGDRDREAMIWE